MKMVAVHTAMKAEINATTKTIFRFRRDPAAIKTKTWWYLLEARRRMLRCAISFHKPGKCVRVRMTNNVPLHDLNIAVFRL